MKSLAEKKIILGVTGSIAAYKAAHLTRLLIKSGAFVRVIMTEASKAFISPLTLSTLSKHRVHTDLMDQDSWDNHVELGLWADIMLIAPATASSISKMAIGLSDNMLTATYLSVKCPVFVAPAMDVDMWKHPATQNNINLLQAFGHTIIPVGFGELASGLVGEGRMAEPEHIVEFLQQYFTAKQDLAGKRILITAGPTFEDIDPVRYLGNNSSGKMGIALAEEAQSRGAEVYLVQGPGAASPAVPLTEVIRVRSAQEMYEACNSRFPSMHAAILSAAVADYTPIERSPVKLKKAESDLNIPLTRTIDIAAQLGKSKKANQKLVGFALETNNAMENANSKLQRKNLDFIVLNSLEDEGAGFALDTNKITIINRDGNQIAFPLKSKKKVAVDIIDHLVALF